MGYELIDERFLTEAEAKELLKKLNKKEMIEEQKKAFEHVENAKISLSKAKILEQKLTELNISKLKPKFIVKIIDFMPKNMDELKIILQTSTISFNEEEMEKILNTVKENGK